MDSVWLFVIILGALLCGSLTFWLMGRMLLLSFRRNVFMDRPGKRKVHLTLVPRVGGVVFTPVLGFVALLLMGSTSALGFSGVLGDVSASVVPLSFFFCALLLLYATGVGDDIMGIAARRKLLVQIFCGMLLVAGNLTINRLHGFLGAHALPPTISWPLTVLVVVFVVNSINLIDGLDGLCGGFSLLAFAPLVVPCYDVLRVYTSRLRHGRSPFCPDKSHIHHKLMALGFRPRLAVLLVVLLAVVFGGGDILLSPFVGVSWLVFGDLLLWIAFNQVLSRLIKRRTGRTWKEIGMTP